MPSLYQEVPPISSSVPRCYWAVDYIPVQPFCLSSKLTEQEARNLSDFEEMLFWERLSNNSFEAFDAFAWPGDMEGGEADNLVIDRQSLRSIELENRLNLYFSAQATETLERAKNGGSCNTHNNGGRPPKNDIYRPDFLAR